MEKTIKKLSIIALMLVMVITLVGCGKKEDEEKKEEKVDDNTIIATKESETEGIKYTEETEIKLKDKKVDTVKMSMEFETEEMAKEMKTQTDASLEIIKSTMGDIGMKISLDGKKVIMELDAAAFSTMAGVDVTEEEVTKADLKAELEKEGYKVK